MGLRISGAIILGIPAGIAAVALIALLRTNSMGGIIVFFVIIIAVLIGLIPAMIASSKGHNFAVWWLYGAALFIIALPHSLMLGVGGTKATCPFCREAMSRDATVCPHCHREMKDKTCPNCQRRLTALIDFCPGCATDLRHIH